MVVISKKRVEEMLFANLLYELHRVKEKIKLFQGKYGSHFKNFEEKLKTSEKEDFEKWDDYMEWKAYENALKKLLNEKKDLEVGNYKVS